MLNLKNLFRNMKLANIYIYRIRFFFFLEFKCFKQIEEKITKKRSHYK